MTGSSKAIDLFTILFPLRRDVSPISKPPANLGSETVRGERSRFSSNLHIYTDSDCLSSVNRSEIWTLTKTTGSNLSLDTSTGRTTLMKRPVKWVIERKDSKRIEPY